MATSRNDEIRPVTEPPYAVDENAEQVTVLGTMGQDPDAKQTISMRSWIIVILCGIAMFQNTYIAIVRPLPFPSPPPS